MHRSSLFIVIIILCFFGNGTAQEQQTVQDSLTYRAIEKFSRKSKITHFLHQFIFKTIVPETGRQIKKSKTIKPKPYRIEEGKIIRKIHIVTTGPFGYSINDTSTLPRGILMKTGNALHVNTWPGIIKNLLLFKTNTPFDSLLVKESERIIRSQRYVRDVILYALPSARGSDSLDVYIRVCDNWSIQPGFNLSNSILEMGLTDNNFVGIGQSIGADMQWYRPSGSTVTRISYIIPNISNTYISSEFHYSFPDNSDQVKSIEFTRPFYSPVVKWAGGIFLGQMLTGQTYILNDTIRAVGSRTNIQDYWAARSWQVFKGSTIDARTTRIILSGRMLIIRYPGRGQEAETANVLNNQNFYFAGIGISSRKYIQDKYIFNYGKIEDVPVGGFFGITPGLNLMKTYRWYLGLKAAWGKYYSFGYLSTHLEYETFIHGMSLQQEVITCRINYFTHLITLGNWSLRQFIKPTLIFGINRLPSDNLTFSEGMNGFVGLAYAASHMMVLTLQTQSYAPWNLLGFRFGPYLFASFGMLGNETSGFSHSRLYSLFGLGVLIKNDYLVFGTFQISLSFYPIIPGTGTNMIRLNGYQTSDYGFRDFEISKPGVVVYR